MLNFKPYILSLAFILLSFIGNTQDCIKPLKNCKHYSPQNIGDIRLQLDTIIDNNAQLIFWNLTKNKVCVNSYFNTLEVEIQYLSKSGKWISNDYGDWCGTGYGLSSAIQNSYTRNKYFLNHIAGEENHKIRFYTGLQDTTIYSNEVFFKIDPNKIRSQQDKQVYYLDRILGNKELSNSEKRNILLHKSQLLFEVSKYQNGLKIYEDLIINYPFSEDVVFHYVQFLLTYKKEKSLDKSNSYILDCKCIALLNIIPNSSKYKEETIKLLSQLNDSLVSEQVWLEMNRNPIETRSNEKYSYLENISLQPIRLLFIE